METAVTRRSKYASKWTIYAKLLLYRYIHLYRVFFLVSIKILLLLLSFYLKTIKLYYERTFEFLFIYFILFDQTGLCNNVIFFAYLALMLLKNKGFYRKFGNFSFKKNYFCKQRN